MFVFCSDGRLSYDHPVTSHSGSPEISQEITDRYGSLLVLYEYFRTGNICKVLYTSGFQGFLGIFWETMRRASLSTL